MTYVGTRLPTDYIEALDSWRLAQDDPQLTRSDAVEYFIAKGLEMAAPSFAGRRRRPSESDRDERAEKYCQLYAELGTYTAVAREVGFSVDTVKRVIHSYERRVRFPRARPTPVGA